MPPSEAGRAAAKPGPVSDTTPTIISDRYQIVSHLGGGEATDVYKVKDIVGDMVLALKILRQDAAKEAELRLSREFYHLSRFSHSGIVKALDFGTSQDHRPFFTMEYSDGKPINTYFQEGYAPELEDLAVQALHALDSIHTQGLIHCDIKPAHILVETNGDGPRVKLLDFGFAEQVSLADASAPRGTLGYVAPEVFKGTDADARADLYSLGMVLYEIVTGRGPSGEKDIRSWLKRQYCTEFEPPSKFDKKIPPRFEAMLLSLIHKEPDRRPRNAAAVVESLVGPDARQTTAIELTKYLMAPSFVGRTESLGLLRDVLQAGAKGQGHVVCISGERGVGKSRLMNEFKFMAQLEGATILTFEPASLGARPQSLVETVLDYLRVYSKAELPAADEANRIGVSEEAKYRLFETITQRLKEMAASHRVEHSVVLVVDDFELFDPNSLEYLRYLGFSLDNDRISVLVCGLKEKRFLDLIDEFGRTGHFTHVSLTPMEGTEVRALVESLLGSVPNVVELTDWLMNATGGNPLFVIESVRALIDGRALVAQGGRWAVDLDVLSGYRPPDTVTDVVKRRLVKLADEEMEVLEIGAAAGGPFTLEFLRAVLKYDEKVLFNTVGRLKSLGLLRTFAGEGLASFVLSSKILEAVVTERLSVEKRRDNHRRVALALELLYPEQEDRLVLDLAHHYAQAEITDRAYAYSVRAGAKAREYQLSEQALGFYETALRLSTAHATPKDRVDLMMTVGDLRDATGKSAEAIDIYTQGMGLVVANKDLASQKPLLSRLLRKLGKVYQRRGQHRDALNYFSQALLMQTGKQTTEYIDILDDLGWSHCLVGSFDKSEALLTEALQLTEKLKARLPDEHKRLSARTLYYFSVLAWSKSDFVLALQLGERSLGEYEDMHDNAGVARLSQFIATLWWRRGDLKKAEDFYLRFVPDQRKSGEVYALLRSLQGLGIIYQDLGDWGKAYDYFSEALRLADRTGDNTAIVHLSSNLGTVCEERGGWDAAQGFYTRALGLHERIEAAAPNDRATVLSNMARLRGKQGDIEEAERLLAEALAIAEQTRDPSLLFYTTSCQVDLALQAERLDAAARRLIDLFKLRRQEPDRRELAGAYTLASRLRLAAAEYHKAINDARRALLLLEDHQSSKEYAVALRCSGLAKCFEDKPERGTQEIRRSIDLLRGLGSKYELGLSLLASAQALTRRHKGEQAFDMKVPVSFRPVTEQDLAAAQVNLKEAETIFQGLGAKVELQRTDELIEMLTQVSATMQLKAKERGEYLKVFYRLSETMSMDQDKEDFAERVLDLVIEVTRAERGMLFLMQGNKLVQVASRGVDQATAEDAQAVSQSVLRKVKQRGEMVFSSDAMADPRFSRANSVMLNQIRSLLCAPLMSDDRVVGTIYLDSRITAHLFLEDDQNLLNAVANLLGATMVKSATYQRLQDEMAAMREDILVDAATGFFLGRSKAIKEVYKVIDRIAETDCTVLLPGETGTGKGVLARLIHSKSERRGKKFVSINCGTLPENLFESELFGHARGSFTGAVKDKEGLFEMAEGGTVFLDEITNTTLSIQAKLLQVLEEKVIRRVGETETRRVDVRLICATNRSLEQEVRAGRFREDLFYRMNVVTIKVPPLRERAVDIPALANFFVKRYAKQLNKPVTGFEDRVLAAFSNYQWPGNVREMQNVIERAVIMTQKRRVIFEDLGGVLAGAEASSEDNQGTRRRAFDRSQVLGALKDTRGNVTKAAELLGTHRRQLQRLMQRYKIDRQTLE
jgi:Nif-specific regulatory protein